MRKHCGLGISTAAAAARENYGEHKTFRPRLADRLISVTANRRALIHGITGRLHKLPSYVNFAIGLILLAPIWRLDHLTGTQVSMSVFYLIPISYAAWFSGGSWAYAMSFIAAAAWLEADLAVAHHYSHWIIPYWNAAVRLAFFIIVTSISALALRFRKLNDLEHEAKRTAEEASQLKSKLLSLVSHEFGNSLATFKLSLTLLEESEGENLPEQRARAYGILKRVFAHLNNAVSNFLNLNRFESGRFQPDIHRTPIRSLAHATIAVLEPLIEGKDIRLNLDFPPNPVPVRADPDALSLVLSNLIGNAFKYTPPGGTVTVRIAQESGPTPKVLVSVEDTGIGISPEDQKKLFSEFYRTEKGKELAKGFGVGLKVTYDLLEAQGSRLHLESVPGKGSRFFFHLPLWVGEESSTSMMTSKT